tara:strand:+ start:347 stop:766 length:420 start_codon:yes stop_codon:yes gene_type:complete
MINATKVNNFLESKMGEPFVWGTNDCNTFILEYLDKIIGSKVHEIAYKKYDTEFGAVKFQKKYGQTVSEKCLELGLIKISPSKSTFGDILVKHNENWDSCHICIGSKIISVDEGVGVVALPIPDFNFFDSAYRVVNAKL